MMISHHHILLSLLLLKTFTFMCTNLTQQFPYAARWSREEITTTCTSVSPPRPTSSRPHQVSGNDDILDYSLDYDDDDFPTQSHHSSLSSGLLMRMTTKTYTDHHDINAMLAGVTVSGVCEEFTRKIQVSISLSATDSTLWKGIW